MKKKFLFVLFALIILSIPLYLMITSEEVLENGNRHKIRLQAYDPFDPFRGKYLRVNYDNFISGDEDIKEGDDIYVTLEKDSTGYSQFSYAHKNQPEGNDYFKSHAEYVSGGSIEFRTDNISKYFINENKASEAETILQTFPRKNSDSIYVAIRVLDGEIRLEDIYVKEMPLLEYIDLNN